jgi:hypothetical protein
MDREYLVYLYCVTAEPPDLARVEDPPGALYLVRAAGLCAVVSQVEAGQFEPSSLRRHLEDLDWVAAETTGHERIVEAVMRDRSVIPFRFATLFQTDDNLRTQLRTHGAQFKTLLEQLEGKAEWGAKAYCDPEKLGDHIRAGDSSVSELNETIRLAPPGRAFLLGKKREELVKTALAGRVNRYAEQMVEALQAGSFQVRRNNVLPPGATDRPGAMILNAAFLVANHEAPAFREEVNALNERFADTGILVECSGPWPPYNFCDLAYRGANVPARPETSSEDARPARTVANG